MREISVEVTGKTEDEAVQAALQQLGRERDEVTVEIIERAKSGFLGLGASPAVVKVSYTETEETPAERAERFLTGLFERMDAEAEPVIQQDDDGLKIELKGSNLGPLIGRRGETLDAIQHLTNYVVNQGADKRTRVSLDAENYRSKREESLIRLAEKEAGKVVRYRKNRSLEPMNSYERHVIHTALQEMENVSTYSTGTEPNRRIIIAYSRSRSAAPGSDHPAGGDRRGPRPGRSQGDSRPRTESQFRTEDESQAPPHREWS